jgi:hypothetical protein
MTILRSTQRRSWAGGKTRDLFNTGAGKGDAHREDFRKYQEGYEQINWPSQKKKSQNEPQS